MKRLAKWYEDANTRRITLRRKMERKGLSPAEWEEYRRLDKKCWKEACRVAPIPGLAMIEAILEVRECSCCGSEKVYYGVMSATSYGVQCENERCRLKIERTYVRNYPKGINTFDELKFYVLAQAIKAWNRRPKK